MFTIEFTPEALDDLRQFRAYECRQIIAAIEEQLHYQPYQETRNRKRLRPNTLAEWELRVDVFRIFYDVDTDHQSVKIEAIGYKKGNQLLIHGEKYAL
jgi:mRNA-degrading endonuclease RelE of RelBE toxin-antitoxin system